VRPSKVDSFAIPRRSNREGRIRFPVGSEPKPHTRGNPLDGFTPAEQALYSVVETIKTPRTASEIVDDLITNERPELREQHSSLGNRGWVSGELNNFARSESIGKYRDGRKVRYAPDIDVAVQNWAMKNDVLVSELQPGEHADQIIADTNMDRDAIVGAIGGIQSPVHT
jgi:hypothetical protein